MLWRRLDGGGHDACRLHRRPDGYRLDGAAVFVADGRRPAKLVYEIACDLAFRARAGRVQGWVGDVPVAAEITRDAAGEWLLDGVPAACGGDCVDLDLGFTPATNLLVCRRLALAEGQAADAPAAWLDVEARRLERLEQRYERRSALGYWYEAPRFEYGALLEISPEGFVLRYPGLWEAET